MAVGKRAPLRSWATPVTIAASLVTGTTGVMLLVGVGKIMIKPAHEWIGLIMVVAGLLHVAANWGPFKRYFTERLGIGTMAAVLAVTGLFLIAQATHERRALPPDPLSDTVQRAPLSLVAQLRGEPVEQTMAKLEAAGLKVGSPDRSLADIARDNGRPQQEALSTLFPQRKRPH